MLKTIVKKGDPVLEKKCHAVTKFDDKLARLLDDMTQTLEQSGGVGLAAPQIGICRRVVVLLDGDENVIELVNPEIVSSSGEQTGLEGCLSLPGYWGEVTRPMKVKVKAQDRSGNQFEVEDEGMVARCFCHEIDHLDGRLFIDVYRDQQKEHKSEAAAQTEPDEKKS